jgi:hypothetical protein
MASPLPNSVPPDLEHYAIRLDEQGHVQFEQNVNKLQRAKIFLGRFLCNLGFLTGASYKTSKIWEVVQDKTDGLSDEGREQLISHLKQVILKEQGGNSFRNWYTRKWHDRKINQIVVDGLPQQPAVSRASNEIPSTEIPSTPVANAAHRAGTEILGKNVPVPSTVVQEESPQAAETQKRNKTVLGLIEAYLRGLDLAEPYSVGLATGSKGGIALYYAIDNSQKREGIQAVVRHLQDLSISEIEVIEHDRVNWLDFPGIDIKIGEKGVKVLYSLLR